VFRCPTRLPVYSPAHVFTRLNSTVGGSPRPARNMLTHERPADEGGVTKMSGGIQAITLPAGYLGSSFIGACLIACGFDTNASKVACLVLAVFFLFTLWWARKNWLYVQPNGRSPNEVLKFSQVLDLDCRHVWPHYPVLVCRRCSRSEISCEHPSHYVFSMRITSPQVLFIGVMSCMYVLWDVIGAHSLWHL